MKKTLQSMVIFIKKFQFKGDSRTLQWKDYYKKTTRHAALLLMPPQLYMFIPCGKDGKPMKEPYNYHELNNRTLGTDLVEGRLYQEAEARVLFPGWEVVEETIIASNEIEIHHKDGLILIFSDTLGCYSQTKHHPTLESMTPLNMEMK